MLNKKKRASKKAVPSNTVPSVPLEVPGQFVPIQYDPAASLNQQTQAILPQQQQPPSFSQQPPDFQQQQQSALLGQQLVLERWQLPTLQQQQPSSSHMQQDLSFPEQSFGRPMPAQPSTVQRQSFMGQLFSPTLNEFPPYSDLTTSTSASLTGLPAPPNPGAENPPFLSHFDPNFPPLFDYGFSNYTEENDEDTRESPPAGSMEALEDDEDPSYIDANTTIRSSDNPPQSFTFGRSYDGFPPDYIPQHSRPSANAHSAPSHHGAATPQINPAELHRRLSTPIHTVSHFTGKGTVYMLIFTKTSAPPADVLGAHRSRRPSVRMPTPYQLTTTASQSHSRSASVASADSLPPVSSHASQASTSSRFITRTSQHGISRQFRTVTRRTRDDCASITSSLQTSGEALKLVDKANLREAISIYIAKLCEKNAWPVTVLSKAMAAEACLQANTVATKKKTVNTDFGKKLLTKVFFKRKCHIHTHRYLQVTHAGSTWRGGLKTFVFDNIKDWDIQPSVDVRNNMTDAQLKQHIADAVQALLQNQGFLHYGTDAAGVSSRLVQGSAIRLLQYPFQNPAHFNHPAYHGIIDKYFYGKNGIARKFPHRFGPMFALPAMAITATMVRLTLVYFACTN